MWTVERYVGVVREMERFSRPLVSYGYYAGLVVAILFADMNYIVHYLLALLILTMLYNHPLFPSYLK